MATSKTWTLEPDPEKPGPRKTFETVGCRKKTGRPHCTIY